MNPIGEYDALVVRGEDCWDWSGSKLPHGYGYFYCGPKRYYAHRIAWELRNGPIPKGMVVCHKCDNPSCSRPDHLFLGTQKDNIHDAIRKGRRRTSKRPLEQIRAIRAARASGRSHADIAREFGIPRRTVSHIITDKWRHVT